MVYPVNLTLSFHTNILMQPTCCHHFIDVVIPKSATQFYTCWVIPHSSITPPSQQTLFNMFGNSITSFSPYYDTYNESSYMSTLGERTLKYISKEMHCKNANFCIKMEIREQLHFLYIYQNYRCSLNN